MRDDKPPNERRRSSSVQVGDSEILASLGKKQVLKRRFGFVSLFGFAVHIDTQTLNTMC